MVPTTLWQTVTRVLTTSWQVAWLVLLALWPQGAGACRYTVRDVAMVDLAEPHYQLCLVTKDGLAPFQVRSLAAVAASILADSNVEFRLVEKGQLDTGQLDTGQLDTGQRAVDPADVSTVSAMRPRDITSPGFMSYPAAVLLAPDGRKLRLPRTDDQPSPADHSIQEASLRRWLRSAIWSQQRDELLHYLLRGHSVVLVVEGTDRANNERAIAWVEDAIARIRAALPTMAKPIELPPRMIRLSPEEAKREQVLLWSLGVDLPREVNLAKGDQPSSTVDSGLGAGGAQETGLGSGQTLLLGLPHQQVLARQELQGVSTQKDKLDKASEPLTGHQPGRERDLSAVTQIALLFGRGRKLGPVLRIPGSRQQDLWRSLGVVGADCECGLDRGWMRGPMIPHAWSTTDEAEAVAALGFDPGNPLVKAEISRILARGPWQSQNAESWQSSKVSQEPLPPQLQLVEIDIDELTAATEARAAEAAVSHRQPARGSSGAAGLEPPTPQTQHLASLPGTHFNTMTPARTPARGAPATRHPAPGQVAASRMEDAQSADLVQAAENPRAGSANARDAITWVLVALSLVGVLGSLGIILRGWRKQG